MAKKNSPALLGFVGDNTCLRLIWTQGERKGFLGFFNEPHCNTMDCLSRQVYSCWFDNIAGYQDGAGYKKVEEIEKIMGIGLPTTCSYNIVLHGEEVMHSSFVSGCFSVPI